MRTARFLSASLLLISATTLLAESKNPADYPLRLHIFSRNETTFYHNRYAEEAKGEGRGNLFADGEVHAVDFSFDCSEKVRASFGFETYPAKWKKEGQELTVLFPVFGKTGSFFTCNLKTATKDYAYVMRNGAMSSEPAAEFKAWMVKHEYDPEHGKDMPLRLPAQAAAGSTEAKPAGPKE